MSGDPWFRRIPVWGAPVQVGPGPCMQAPDYSQQRPPQPGETVALLPPIQLPQHNSAVAQAEDVASRLTAPKRPPANRRPPPYLPLFKPVIYSATAALNWVDLGKPDAGVRWLIRQLSLLPGTTINDATGTGAYCDFYIGTIPQPGAIPTLTEWAWVLGPLSATVFATSQTFTSDALQVQSTQHLLAYVTNGVVGFPYVPQSRVLQIPDRGQMYVQEV